MISQIMLKLTPKFSISQEIGASRNQKRYMDTMSYLVSYIGNLKKYGIIKDQKTITNTGFVFYNNITEEVIKLCSEIYHLITKFKNPQCQIIWAVVSQKYSNIQVVDSKLVKHIQRIKPEKLK